jgi:hypothetical protein
VEFADLVAWFRSQGDMVSEINSLCHFDMDNGLSRELDFNPDGLENASDHLSDTPSLQKFR